MISLMMSYAEVKLKNKVHEELLIFVNECLVCLFRLLKTLKPWSFGGGSIVVNSSSFHIIFSALFAQEVIEVLEELLVGIWEIEGIFNSVMQSRRALFKL